MRGALPESRQETKQWHTRRILIERQSTHVLLSECVGVGRKDRVPRYEPDLSVTDLHTTTGKPLGQSGSWELR